MSMVKQDKKHFITPINITNWQYVTLEQWNFVQCQGVYFTYATVYVQPKSAPGIYRIESWMPFWVTKKLPEQRVYRNERTHISKTEIKLERYFVFEKYLCSSSIFGSPFVMTRHVGNLWASYYQYIWHVQYIFCNCWLLLIILISDFG